MSVVQIVVLEMTDKIPNADDSSIDAAAALDIGGTTYNGVVKIVMRSSKDDLPAFPDTLTINGGSIDVEPA